MYVVQVGHYAWLSTFNGATCLTTSGAHADRMDEAQATARARDFQNHSEFVIANSRLTPLYAKLAPTLPVTVVPASKLDARLAKRDGTGDRGGDNLAARIAFLGKDKSAAMADHMANGPKREPKAPGVTRQIFDWVISHPEATKADVVAAFPNANPSTVSVQFGAARKAQRG